MVELIDKSQEILKYSKNDKFKKFTLKYFYEYKIWLEELDNII